MENGVKLLAPLFTSLLESMSEKIATSRRETDDSHFIYCVSENAGPKAGPADGLVGGALSRRGRATNWGERSSRR